jgi:hypothetical protein
MLSLLGPTSPRSLDNGEKICRLLRCRSPLSASLLLPYADGSHLMGGLNDYSQLADAVAGKMAKVELLKFDMRALRIATIMT